MARIRYEPLRLATLRISENFSKDKRFSEDKCLWGFLVHRGFIVVGYDGVQNVRDEEDLVGRKKPGRKTEPKRKRKIVWPKWTGFRGMTLREWLELLIVPLALVVIGFMFTLQQDRRQQQIEDQRAQQAQKLEDQRAQQAQKLEDQRAEADRAIQQQNAQDEALQAYLDQLNTLLLEKGLRSSEEVSEVRILARARTLTVLERLDPSRKTAVMQFLVEAELVQRVNGREPIIGLSGANLSDFDLVRADLRGADLAGADLSDAQLFGAELSGANLSDADLRGARMYFAHLRGADLGDANLSDAYLRFADLSEASLGGADLSNADLSEADLRDAYLFLTDLGGTDFRGADLSDADLHDAHSGYVGNFLPQEELQAADSLEGAIMPDSQLIAGEHVTDRFEPAFQFEVGEGWLKLGGGWYAPPETTNGLYLRIVDNGGYLIFTNPLHVFDPSNLSELKELPEPENADEWVSWFQRHPNLDTSKPVPVSVGGASGKRIDVTHVSTPENYPRDVCEEQLCVPLYKGSTSQEGVLSYDGWKARIIILDVGGEMVLIDVAAPAEWFDKFLPQAQKVLDTVEWVGSK